MSHWRHLSPTGRTSSGSTGGEGVTIGSAGIGDPKLKKKLVEYYYFGN